MTGRRRLAGAGLEGNQAGRSNLSKARANQNAGKPRTYTSLAPTLQRGSKSLTLQRHETLAAGAAALAFPRWSVGTSKRLISTN